MSMDVIIMLQCSCMRPCAVEPVDTNALRRVGVELDDEWSHEQAGNIMYDIASEAAVGHA